MRFREFAAALIILGAALTAGCPDGAGLGLPFAAIPDGTYAGSVDGFVEIWHWDELYQQGSGGGESAATFVNGAIVKDSGQDLQIGDVEDVDFGSFTATREVFDVQVGAGFYEVAYEVYAEWETVPMYGTEVITFTGNADGSVAMVDTLELTSLADYDGGAWTFYAETSGALSSVQGPVEEPEDPPFDILDLKSGKFVIGDATTR
ncbi:MAG TPA: hypothetical protein VJZ71_03645 [Phycisphaerae bacterium]|nr:hypothetical protein [Phycisphaerae bacterium]